MTTSNKRRFKRRLKKFQKQYIGGEIDLEQIRQSLASYNGHLQHGHTWKLKKTLYGRFVLVYPGTKDNAVWNLTGEDDNKMRNDEGATKTSFQGREETVK